MPLDDHTFRFIVEKEVMAAIARADGTFEVPLLDTSYEAIAE